MPELCFIGRMLKEQSAQQFELEMVTLDSLVPADHLLRQIDRYIDFSFIRPKVEHLYCSNNGRPALDPEALFKMLFIGYLFGVRSERQLVREIEVNVAYRWFLRLRLTDKVPDASTISQNRRRRFRGTTIHQEIFDNIVEQAMTHGLLGGQALYTDSTHLKANANKNRHDKVEVEITPPEYWDALDQAVEEDRAAHGKKPLPPKKEAARTKTIRQSLTDSDAGYMVRDNKPEGFFYLDHRTVDGLCNLITDTWVTPGNVHDSMPYLNRLDRQCERFGLQPIGVGLDAGYFTAAICKGLEERSLYGVMGYRRPTRKKGYLSKRHYRYDAQADVYHCPAGQALIYKTTDRNGYRHYQSDPILCEHCVQRAVCTQNKKYQKTVTRHVWEDSKERIDANRLTDYGKQFYARRKETVERSFADAKELHGHRYARFRGIDNVREQCLLEAACQNMKKIAQILTRKAKTASDAAFSPLLRAWQALIGQIADQERVPGWQSDYR